MTAAELITELQKVAPTTEVTIATKAGSTGIEAVRSLGYYGGKIALLAED